MVMCYLIQQSAKEWSLGCVKRALAVRGGQDAGITQIRDHSLADPCTFNLIYNSSKMTHVSNSEIIQS